MSGPVRRAARDWPGADDLAPPAGFEDAGGMASVIAIDQAHASDERELLDFLAADIDPVPADPAFRERLREELWAMVLDGQDARPEES